MCFLCKCVCVCGGRVFSICLGIGIWISHCVWVRMQILMAMIGVVYTFIKYPSFLFTNFDPTPPTRSFRLLNNFDWEFSTYIRKQSNNLHHYEANFSLISNSLCSKEIIENYNDTYSHINALILTLSTTITAVTIQLEKPLPLLKNAFKCIYIQQKYLSIYLSI